MENLFEKIANISKTSAYDILVEQVKELKAENGSLISKVTTLREALQNLVKASERSNCATLSEDAAKEALKQTK